MDDKRIQRRISEELSWEPSLDSADIGVTVDDGVAHMFGHVPTLAQKASAEDVLRRTRGVRGFINDLLIRPFQPMLSDDDIAERAANVLGWLVDFPHDSVRIKVSQGVLTLMGSVDWAYQREAAFEAVHRIAGIRKIENELVVAPKSRAENIEHDIESALDRQAGLSGDQIEVTVKDGVVQLSGWVRSFANRGLAERIAWSAEGVERVYDRLVVSP